jgi:hypothetical protein
MSHTVHSEDFVTVRGMSYPYRPLQGDDKIRLVEIEPARYDREIINCEIIHVRKSDLSLEYEALSYTWGDASKLKSIVIGASHEFHVTSNCYDALRRFRDHDGKRLIWIDAICINQEDDAERTQQVGIMGEIYRCASQVLVYLGEADENSKRVFDHVAQLQFYNENSGKDTDFGEKLPKDFALVEATRAVLQRSWFSRVWVLQEVYQNPRNVKVVCGPDSVFWRYFSGCCMHLCKSKIVDFGEYSAYLPHVLTIGAENRSRGLFELLCQTRHAAATDPRDKFFAILSMIREDKNALSLSDYSQNTTMVYTAVGLYLLQKCKLLLLLAVRHRHSTYPALASWIPDWSRSDDNDPFWINSWITWIGTESWFDDSQVCKLELRVLGCCRPSNTGSDHLHHPVISVSGFRAGRIRSLGARFDFETSSSACLEALKRILESEGRANNTLYLPPGFTSDCKSRYSMF